PVPAGQSAPYAVPVTRSNGFTGPVHLSAGNLPGGATASWKLSDVTTSNFVPSGQNAATLQIQTANSSPNGTFKPSISGTSGNLSHTTSVTQVVQPAQQANFTLAAIPASRTVLQTDQTSYTVGVSRSGGFSGAVNLA